MKSPNQLTRELPSTRAKGARAGRSNFTLILSLRKSRQALAMTERRLRTILENVTEGVVELDSGGKVLAWNRAAEEMFRWSRPEILNRQLSEAVLCPDSRQHFEQRLRELTEGGEPATNGPSLIPVLAIRPVHGEPELFPALVSLTTMSVSADEPGSGKHFYAFFREQSVHRQEACDSRAA